MYKIFFILTFFSNRLYMSGKFTNLVYDDKAYLLQQERSTAPGNYMMFSGRNENCETCYPHHQPTNSRDQVSTAKKDGDLGFGNLANIESLLTNRVNPSTKDNQFGKNDEYKNTKINHKGKCSDYLESNDTRFTNPIDNYRGMSLTDYYLTPYLHVNPQCYFQEDTHREGSSSRLQVRDCYKTPNQNKWDKGGALPPPAKSDGGIENNKDCKMVCGK